MATGIDETSDKKRVCTLLSVIGEDAVKVYDTFEYVDGESADSVEDVLTKFEEYCSPRKNTIYERYKFQCRNQEAGESGSQYMTELRHMAENCDYVSITTSQIIRDRFVHGLRDSKVRERLLRAKELTADQAYEMVQASEATAEQVQVMSGDQAVCAVKAQGGYRQGRQGRGGNASYRTATKPRTNYSSTECKYCPYEHGPRSCPAYGKECRKCGKKNHFQSKCQQRYVKLAQAECDDENEYSVGTLTVYSVGHKRRAMITLDVGDDKVAVPFQIDSGADCCVLPREEYVRVTGDSSLAKLRPVKTVIVTYTGTRETALGQCKLLVTRKGVKHRLVFNVLQGNYTPILSLDASEGMHLLEICDSDPLDHIYSACELTALTMNNVNVEYADVFSGLGMLKDCYTIQIDDSVRPVVHAPRRIPVPMREKVREKLDELENEGVIVPVTEATDWVSSMVVVQKPNKQIRLCLDPKDLNAAIKREYYPIPTIEEVSTRLKNARLFTVLDAKSGFWQIPLDEKSSM